MCALVWRSAAQSSSLPPPRTAAGLITAWAQAGALPDNRRQVAGRPHTSKSRNCTQLPLNVKKGLRSPLQITFYFKKLKNNIFFPSSGLSSYMKLCGFILLSGIEGNHYFLMKIRSWANKIMSLFAAVVLGQHTPDLRNKLYKFKYEFPGTR